VLEDLQWADEPTLQALVHVARARPPVGLLVVGTYRDTELIGRDALTAALGELSLQSDMIRLRLAGLDAGEVAALVAAIRTICHGWRRSTAGPGATRSSSWRWRSWPRHPLVLLRCATWCGVECGG